MPVTKALVAIFASLALADDFFPGQQTGIGSWFRANNKQDSTNGKSWCGYAYSDSDPLFAVSLKAMGGATYNTNPDAWKAATEDYCGREATVTDPGTGKTMTMYIGDAFDDQYVRSPGSIDIMIDSFSSLHGNPNGDKDDVIKNVQWQLTGKMNPQYNPAHKSSVDGSSGSSGSGASPTTTTMATETKTASSSKATATCDWGCEGWDCSDSVPCQSPNSCKSGYCRAQ